MMPDAVRPDKHDSLLFDTPHLRISCDETVRAVLIHAWPSDLSDKREAISAMIGAHDKCAMGRVASGPHGVAAQFEPMKFMVFDCERADFDDSCEMSDVMVRLRIMGSGTRTMLARLVDLDLRAKQFSEGSSAATSVHGVDVQLVRTDDEFWLLLPGTYAHAMKQLVELAAKRSV